MDINKMSKEDFLAIPHREDFQAEVGEFTSFVIVPTGVHDSGYRCNDLVLCRFMQPIIKVGGGCDDIELNFTTPTRIDVLNKSKLVHVRAQHGGEPLEVSCDISSMRFNTTLLNKGETNDDK